MTIARPGRNIFLLGGLLVGLLTGWFLGSLINQRQRQLQTAQELLLRSRALNLVLQKKTTNYEKQHPARTANSQGLFSSTRSTVANQFRIRARSHSNSLKPTSLVTITVLNCQSHLLKGAEETWAKASDITVLPIAPLHCRSTLQYSSRMKFIEPPHLTNSSEEFYYAVLDFLYESKFGLSHDWFIVTPVNVYLNSENVNRFTAGLDPTQRHYVALNNTLQFDTTPLLLSQSILKEIVELRKQCQSLCNHDESSFSLSICTEARKCMKIRTATELYRPTELKVQYRNGNNLRINGEQIFDTVMVQPISAFNNAYSIHLFFKLMKYRKLKTKMLQLSNVAVQLLDHISQHDRHYNLVTDSHAGSQLTTLRPAYIRSWAYFNNEYMWYSDQKTYPVSTMSVYMFQQQEVEMALFEAVQAASMITGNRLVLRDFTGGYVRHDAFNGNEYIIDGIFSKPGFFQEVFSRRIHLSRPFSAQYAVNYVKLLRKAEKVHFVVPISNGIQKLALFLHNYEEKFLAKNENTSLTLAVHGNTTIAYAKEVTWKLLDKYPIAADITIITVKGKFSRGRALNAAIDHLRQDNLVFICDVDMILDTNFISRCRSNTKRGKKVYYPEFFKLYNDKYMFRTSADTSAGVHRSGINRQTGHWAYYSYGMVCIYKSDYDAINGFDQSLEGWGGEDVQLVEKIISYGLEVFRAPDTGLMHRWHKKDCKITDNQYRECLWSKSENLADKLDLARLAFSIEEAIYSCE